MKKIRWKIAQAAEIRWWQGYLKNKSTEEYLTWKLSYWRTFLQKIGVQLKGQSQVLDVGCGPAGIYMALEDCQVTALDPLLNEYESKLAHFEQSMYPHVRFVDSPFEDFAEKKAYETVFSINAINHVDDLDLCFDKIVNLTKSGGQLVVSIDAHNYSAFKHLFRLLPGDILHPHQYDLHEYSEMLTSRGCTIERTICYKREFFFDYYVLVCRKG